MASPKKRPPVSVPRLTAERIQALRELLPEAFSEGKIDFEKLRAALSDLVDEASERYSFSWDGKRDAIRLLQTELALEELDNTWREILRVQRNTPLQLLTSDVISEETYQRITTQFDTVLAKEQIVWQKVSWFFGKLRGRYPDLGV